MRLRVFALEENSAIAIFVGPAEPGPAFIDPADLNP